jgi:hypothetical protein
MVPFFEATFVFRGISVFDIHNAVENIYSLYGEWDSDLQRIIAEDGGPQQMLDRSLPVFQNPLILYDQNLSTLAFSKEYMEDMPVVSLMEKKKLADYVNTGDFNESYAKQKAAFFTPCTAGVRSLYISLTRPDKSKCRLMLLEVSRKFIPSDTPLLEHLANAVQASINAAVHEGAEAALSYVIKNIRTGEYQDPHFIEQRLGEYGWRQDQRFICLKIAPAGGESPVKALHGICDRLRERLNGAAVFEYDNCAGVFINLGFPEKKAPEEQAPDRAIQPLALLLEEEKLLAGLSSVFSGFGGFPLYFRQARLALSLGPRCRRGERLYRFTDVMEQHLLESCTRELPAGMICAPEIIALLRYDEEHHTDYYRTLRVFLKNNLHPVQTIKELYIHRSTLLYRLQRIQKITGLDMERCDRQWFLLLSFKLLENEQNRES